MHCMNICRLNNICHVAAVGAGIHHHCAAQGSRDSGGPFKTGQAIIHGKFTQGGEALPCQGNDLMLLARCPRMYSRIDRNLTSGIAPSGFFVVSRVQ